METSLNHQNRKHSILSASGAERWFHCSASVEASRGIPSKDSIWSIEGSRGHEVLEAIAKALIQKTDPVIPGGVPKEMVAYGWGAAQFIYALHQKHAHSDLIIENRVTLGFIHPEMFGTLDAAVLDYFGTLHVLDYKYGAGHAVSPKNNLQMIFYALGLAEPHHWNFARVRLWIIQPRIKSYTGPVFWEISIEELKSFVGVFKEAVRRVLEEPEYREGSWCHWCPAKKVCPLKREQKTEKAISAFSHFTKGN